MKADGTLDRHGPPLAVALLALYAVLLGVLHVVPRYDCLVFPLVAWTAFGLLDRAPAPRALVATLAMGLLFAFGVLTHLWTTGHEGRTAVLAGIIPWSDAGQFLSDAERLVHGHSILESSRRPLYVAVLAGVLRATGNDLRVVLALGAALYGVSLGYVSHEARRAHGRVAGFLVFVVAAFWVRRFTGFVATEAASFPPGAVAFGLLLRAADLSVARPRRAAALFGGGVLLVTLALAARPGPLLVVPALLAWSSFAFARGHARRLAVGSGALGALGAVLLVKLVAARFATGATFGDYPNIVYALLHRGDLYTAFHDHPELLALPPEARPAATLRILTADLRDAPSLAVVGPFDAFASFLAGPHGLFSFVWTNPDDHVLEDGALVRRLVADGGMFAPLGHWVSRLGLMSLVNAAVMGLGGVTFALATVVATVRLVSRRHARRVSLVLAIMIAVLASSVFAPTWIGEGMQMQTGVFAFVPYAVAIGLLRARRRRRVAVDPGANRLVFAGAVLVVVPCLLVALVAFAPWPEPPATCDADTITAEIVPGTRVLVAGPDAPPLSSNLTFLRAHNAELVAAVRTAARPGDALALLYDVCAHHTRVAFGPPDALLRGGVMRVTPRPEEPQVVVVGR